MFTHSNSASEVDGPLDLNKVIRSLIWIRLSYLKFECFTHRSKLQQFWRYNEINAIKRWTTRDNAVVQRVHSSGSSRSRLTSTSHRLNALCCTRSALCRSCNLKVEDFLVKAPPITGAAALKLLCIGFGAALPRDRRRRKPATGPWICDLSISGHIGRQNRGLCPKRSFRLKVPVRLLGGTQQMHQAGLHQSPPTKLDVLHHSFKSKYLKKSKLSNWV